jgi:hypothetical protein
MNVNLTIPCISMKANFYLVEIKTLKGLNSITSETKLSQNEMKQKLMINMYFDKLFTQIIYIFKCMNRKCI